jgi:8-oxo-dGTP diphosphatase
MLTKIIIASGPVIVENNKVLLNQHGDTEFWKFCGGTLEQNETLLETVKREVKEEMDLEIKILNQEPFFFYTQKQSDEGLKDVILAHYLAERIGEISPGTDIREWKWFDIDDLPDNLAPNIIPTLKHFGFIK